MARDKDGFSPLRAYFWPIRACELRKFLPLLAMAFFIGFNYNVLRNLKDSLLITVENSGAEVIPFIKVWGIFPGALLLTFIYSQLNNKLKRDHVFFTMVSIFLVFFALFTFVLYPLEHHLHPHGAADFLQSHLPAGFKGMIAMFRYWTFSSFYIMSELWSSTILSMLFWGFANEVTRLGEAKRFYGLIAMGLNMAAIVSGQASVFLTSHYLRSKVAIVDNPWHQSVILLTLIVLFCGGVILSIFRFITRSVLPDEIPSERVGREKEIYKMSMRENFALLGRSKYLLFIALIVLAYNFVINLVEVIWKDRVSQLYPDPNLQCLYESDHNDHGHYLLFHRPSDFGATRPKIRLDFRSADHSSHSLDHLWGFLLLSFRS
jgi:AAA family ATP:ADP antiporter